MSSLNIRQILDNVTKGQIRIPAFQRGFVWEPERIAHLMDSIYKGYPFGSVLLWRTREKLNVERNLGPFELPAPEKDYPVDYVLDGQQRITSLFGTFQSTLTPSDDNKWPEIYFDLQADPHPQETQFIALEGTNSDIDLQRYFPIKVLFDTIEYRKATSLHNASTQERIDQIQATFKEAIIPTQLVETDEKAKVAIIFERINTQGVELDTLQLLSAWTWSEDFQLHEKFRELAEELEPFGFGKISGDSSLILRCCSAIMLGETSPDALMNMKGSEVREQFETITNGIKGAIDFLRLELNVHNLSNLPYPAQIIPLAVFFAHSGTSEISFSSAQRKQILRWFWRTAFSRRYSSGFPRNMATDIAEMNNLKLNGVSELGNFWPQLDSWFFLGNDFRLGTVNTNTYILMLAQNSPRSFISGANVNLADTLKAANRKEFHHLMPKAFLKNSGQTSLPENCLVNFCFLSRADNRELGGVAPSAYKEKLPDNHTEILSAALCPDELWSDNYDVFLTRRLDLLLPYASKLCQLNEEQAA